MNYDKLFEIAKRKAFVQWQKSGTVAQLIVHRARVLSRRDEASKARPLPKREAYYCREIDRSEVL